MHSDLARLKRWLPRKVVLHHADHEIHRITVFCPRLYSFGVLRTWQDDQLFSVYPGTAPEARAEIAQALPRNLQTKYKWGIRPNSELPYGFVFLKRKKLFQKGRTLISYFRSYYGILMQATARTIDSMCVQLWPQSFGQLSVPNIWRCMHNHFSATDPSVHFGAINDDLIGFFNSVPQHRLLDAVRSLICAWRQKHGDVALSVDMSLRGPVVHTTHVGHFSRRAPTVRAIDPSDIIDIVAASLRSHLFMALNKVWKRFRGAGIGAHISPSLSNLAVTIVEKTWQYMFQEAINAPALAFLGVRYVDNRFILFQSLNTCCPCLQVLAHPFFYEHPVELEPVETGEFLGFLVDPVNRTISYKLPEPWQIRDAYSAGSLSLQLSGLLSRAHLIRRYTYPCTAASAKIEELIALYQRKGFSYSDCKKALTNTSLSLAAGRSPAVCVSRSVSKSL